MAVTTALFSGGTQGEYVPANLTLHAVGAREVHVYRLGAVELIAANGTDLDVLLIGAEEGLGIGRELVKLGRLIRIGHLNLDETLEILGHVGDRHAVGVLHGLPGLADLEGHAIGTRGLEGKDRRRDLGGAGGLGRGGGGRLGKGELPKAKGEEQGTGEDDAADSFASTHGGLLVCCGALTQLPRGPPQRLTSRPRRGRLASIVIVRHTPLCKQHLVSHKTRAHSTARLHF